jgi:hypothetical protein
MLRPQLGAERSIDMPLCSHHLQLIHAAREDGREMQAVNSVVESQIRPSLLTANITTSVPGLFQPSVELAAKHWGLAKTASVINFSQPASLADRQAGRTLSLQSNHSVSASMPASDYNNGATLIQAGLVRIHFFL